MWHACCPFFLALSFQCKHKIRHRILKTDIFKLKLNFLSVAGILIELLLAFSQCPAAKLGVLKSG
jgi:hypothetical protein